MTRARARKENEKFRIRFRRRIVNSGASPPALNESVDGIKAKNACGRRGEFRRKYA